MNTSTSKTRWVTGTLLLGSVLTFAVLGISSNAANGWYSGEFGEHEEKEHRKIKKSGFMQDSVYNEECGACHLAYPPALLPLESWHKIMNGLGDHFGENAEIDQFKATHISDYLAQQVLPKEKSSKLNRMLRNMPDEPPLRISALPYFVREHDEIPERLVKENPEVNSFSQCDSCHKDAAKGWFDEHRVTIPGYGRWDD